MKEKFNLEDSDRSCRKDIEKAKNYISKRINEFEMVSVENLVLGIPEGKISIIQGDPGVGKTIFTCQLMAHVTNGTDFFSNEKTKEGGNVIYITDEECIGEKVRPLLEKAGANMERAFTLESKEKPFTMQDDRLKQAIIEHNAKLLVLDPLQAFFPSNMDMHRANEVRPVMSYLMKVAEETKCAIILIAHKNKGEGIKSIYRLNGSIDFAAVPRCIYEILKYRNNPRIKVLVNIKNSYHEEEQPCAFEMSEDLGFKWKGEIEFSEDDIESSKEIVYKKNKAADFILEQLDSCGKIPSKELRDRVKEKRLFSIRTFDAARAFLKERKLINTVKEGSSWYLVKVTDPSLLDAPESETLDMNASS